MQFGGRIFQKNNPPKGFELLGGLNSEHRTSPYEHQKSFLIRQTFIF